MSHSSTPYTPNPAETGAEDLGGRIAHIAETTGGKRKLAALAGIRESQLFRYIRGDNVPSLSAAAAIARAGKVSLEWLAHGGGMEGSGGRDMEAAREAPGAYAATEAWHSPVFLDGGDSPLGFRATWLEELGVAPESALLARTPDDAMTPTLNPGDLILADDRHRAVETAGLYLFRLQGVPVPRRAVPLPNGALRVDCDNPVYPELTLSADSRAELQVLGRLVWTGRRL